MPHADFIRYPTNVISPCGNVVYQTRRQLPTFQLFRDVTTPDRGATCHTHHKRTAAFTPLQLLHEITCGITRTPFVDTASRESAERKHDVAQAGSRQRPIINDARRTVKMDGKSFRNESIDSQDVPRICSSACTWSDGALYEPDRGCVPRSGTSRRTLKLLRHSAAQSCSI